MCIKASGIVPTYSGNIEFSFQLERGVPLGIVGPNGAGKTSLVQYWKCHQDIFHPYQVAFMDQRPLAPLAQLRGWDFFQLLQETFPEDVVASINDFDLIDRFHFRHLLMRRVQDLSGGENQILKLLLLFYIKYPVKIMDEPLQYLDYERQNLLEEVITEYKDCFFIIIDHHQKFLNQVVKSVFYIKKDMNINKRNDLWS